MSDFQNNNEPKAKKKDQDFLDWWDNAPIGHRVGAVIGFVIVGTGLLIGFIFVTMALWNWLMPEIFKLPPIDFWQTVGLLALSMIFFKNPGSKSGNWRSDRKRKHALKKKLQETAEANESLSEDSKN